MIEAVVAVFIFLTLVVFFSGMWVAYARSIEKSSNHLVATYLGQKALEETMAFGYANVNSGGPYAFPVSTQRKGRSVTTTFVYTVDVTEDSTAGLKDILVTVAYPDHGQQREVRFEAMLYRSN